MVESVKRSYTILEVIAQSPNGASVTEISQRTQLPKSTVVRLLATLEALTAVDRVSPRGVYQIGSGIFKLTSAVHGSAGLTARMLPYLTAIANQVGEDSALVLEEQDVGHFVDVVQCENPVQVKDWSGSRVPLHTIASGKVFLAGRSTAEINRYLQRSLERYTEKTITDVQSLRQQLDQIRRDDYHWTFEEFADGLNALAVPVRVAGNRQPLACLTIYGPSFRFPRDQMHQAEIVKRLKAVAAEAAAQESLLRDRLR